MRSDALWLHSMIARISLVAKVPASLAWLPVPADAVCSRELSWLHWFARLQDAKAACVRVHSMVACIAKVQATIADTDRQLPDADVLSIRSLSRLHRSAGLLATQRTASAADVWRSVRGWAFEAPTGIP